MQNYDFFEVHMYPYKCSETSVPSLLKENQGEKHKTGKNGSNRKALRGSKNMQRTIKN
jgi:hypothetical protein